MARLVLTGNLPDGDYKVWAPYPSDLKPHQVAVAKGLYDHLGIAREDHEARDAANRRNCEAFGAPVMGFVLIHKAHGVDSCPLGILTAWRGPLDAEFEIPDDYRLITGFALGYASGEPVNDFRAERRPVRLAAPRS